ncbi:uncharacterized protein LOC125769601 isoform X3 [Anopheles funestus]|uniref:uncharacterized protein LOC128932668 isoform 2 n=1 Tax=Anopheles funestus TaxID=62324 RepID=UPI0020C5EF5F|nr:uncharacterized protein LOC128932668 isoform 2 [Anopheles funestus]
MLPKDARTLLRTPQNIGSQIVPISGGDFWYQGIEKALQCYFRNFNSEINTIEVTLSMDGLPLHTSGTTCFWPILMRVEGIPQAAIRVVAIFCGYSKPENAEEYLRPLVNELNHLHRNGITLNSITRPFKLRCIIGDAPARALIKGVRYYNGKEGCMKCTCHGEYLAEERKVIFVGVGAAARTDSMFRMQGYGRHHREPTPLTELDDFDIIKNVVTSDSLHLLDHGATKKFLMHWKTAKFSSDEKWSQEQIDNISTFIMNMKLPSEIIRRMRSLKFLKYWKGSEFKYFLLYGGIVILRDYLPEEEYDHFLKYFCAITIFSTEVYKPLWVEGKRLIEEFILEVPRTYGREHLTSNIHNLQHIYDDICNFGPLPTISTYPFEGYLRNIKRSMRSGWKCLEQAANRISELNNFETYNPPTHPEYPLIEQKSQLTILHMSSSFILKCTENDQWFLTDSNAIIKFSSATRSPDSSRIVINGFPILKFRTYFQISSLSSAKINIFHANISDLALTTAKITTSNVKCKLVAVQKKSGNGYVFFPLLHTLKLTN